MAHSGSSDSSRSTCSMVAGPRESGSSPSTSRWAGQHGEERADLGHSDQALDPEGDLDQDFGRLVGLLADGPAPVGGLAPGRPVETGVDPDAGRALLPGQAVGGLEAHVTQEDVHLEALLDRLALAGARPRTRSGGSATSWVKTWSSMAGQRLPFFRARLSRARAPDSSPWLERRVIAYAHQGGAWEGPSSTLHAIARRRRCRGHGHRARRPCHRRRAAGGVPRPTPSTGPPTASGAIADVHLRRAVPAGQRLLVGAWRRRDPRTRARTPIPSGAGPRPTTGSASPSWRRCSTEFAGVVLNLDIKQTAPVVAPYEEALADLLPAASTASTGSSWPRSSTRRPTPSRPIAPEFATSAGTLATADFYRAVQAGEPPAPMRHVALQVPAACRRHHPGRRAVRRRGPRAGSGRPRVDDRGRVRDGGSCAASGWTASSPTGPPRWSGCSTAWAARGHRGHDGRHRHRGPRRARGESGGYALLHGRNGPDRSPGREQGRASAGPGGQRSAAPAVRLLAVVGLLLGPELALVGSFGHSLARLLARWAGQPAGVAGGCQTCSPVTWLLRDGDVLAAAEVAEGLDGRSKGLLGRTATTGRWSSPAPARSTPSDAVRHRRGLLRPRPGGARRGPRAARCG